LLVESYLEYPIVELGIYIFRVNHGRKSKGTGKPAVAAFDSVKVLLLLLVFQPAFSGDGEHVVFKPDVEILLGNSRQVGLNGDVVLVFKHIDGGYKVRLCECLLPRAGEVHGRELLVGKHLIKAVLQLVEFHKWVPASHVGHDSSPFIRVESCWTCTLEICLAKRDAGGQVNPLSI